MQTTEIVGLPGNRFRVFKESILDCVERVRRLAYLNGQNAADLVAHAQEGWHWAIEMLEGIAIDPFDISIEQATLADRKTQRESRSLAERFAERNKRLLRSMGVEEERSEDTPTKTTTTREPSKKKVFDKYPATAIVRWLFSRGASKAVMVEVFKELDVSVADATYSCQTSAVKRGAATAPEIYREHELELLELIAKHAEEIDDDDDCEVI